MGVGLGNSMGPAYHNKVPMSLGGPENPIAIPPGKDRWRSPLPRIGLSCPLINPPFGSCPIIMGFLVKNWCISNRIVAFQIVLAIFH